MKIVTKECVKCGKSTKVELSDARYRMYTSGALIQSLGLDRFTSETLISGMCFDCQEKVFNRPAPGREGSFGKEVGCCPVCDCDLWEKDYIGVTDESVPLYQCPSCRSLMNPDGEEVELPLAEINAIKAARRLMGV